MMKFSNKAKKINSSAIREILKVTQSSDIISFAGGVPTPDCFPLEDIKSAMHDLMISKNFSNALQYGPTEGYLELRKWIANYISSREAITLTQDNVLIVSGSQQALDLVGKCFINENDDLFVTDPTYLGAIQAFSIYDPNFVPISQLEELTQSPQNNVLLYIIPNFNNPTGNQLTLEERNKITAYCNNKNMLIIEDDPYGDLSYSGKRSPSILSLAQKNTIYLGSFSKILSPGMRLGYIIAEPEIIKKLVQFKQASDLHTSSFVQYIVFNILNKNNFLVEHLKEIRNVYREKCTVMLKALNQYMPKSVSWNEPNGGMFIWLTLPNYMDGKKLLDMAIKKKVAFVPGEFFFSKEKRSNFIRLSFVTNSNDAIINGIRTLSLIISENEQANDS
ncbi:PLP-dependent aminotransferase family protein [Orbaceae bacterium ESL0727]|nr:PLP-dependent aminotransferase family protein [Orbaceae bacterium ESL0727]